jgi:hypothetical protein
MVKSKFRPTITLQILDQNFTRMPPFQRDTKLIPITQNKTPAQFLASDFMTICSLKLHPLSNIALPEGRVSTVWEPSKPEEKKCFFPSRSLKCNISHCLPPLSILSPSLFKCSMNLEE